ncbi:MAG: hypothetical protein GKR88_21055 [Flavobacteriaceae bacterium]|nr:MAG: hypothetical protein GKR88_21055 [Flavobacteriaceae bacterium]
MGISGVYDINGVKVLDGEEFTWRNDQSDVRFGSCQFLASDPASKLYLWSPVVQKIDGSEDALDVIAQTTTVLVDTGVVNQDMVTHYEYDVFGRQSKEYLPYPSNSSDGVFDPIAKEGTQQYYQNSYADDFPDITTPININAYSEKVLENSPLGRIYEQTAPGSAWKKGDNLISGKGYSDGHTIKFEYHTNTATEVKDYSVSLSFSNNTYTPTLTANGNYYSQGTLTKTITKDENWTPAKGLNHTTEEFKDKSGQVLLKRTYISVDLNDDGDTTDSGESAVAHDTYYIYDDYGNLTYVLPPKIEGTTSGISDILSKLDELGYQYTYDHRNRLVAKKIPGKGWEYIIYDALDRPVLTQDALQRAQKKWLFTKYDIHSRVAYTGVYTHSNTITRINMQHLFDTENQAGSTLAAARLYETRIANTATTDPLQIDYTNENFPKSNTEVFTVNYYDSYDFDRAGGLLPTAVGTVYGKTLTTNIKGLSGGSKTKVLRTSQWITTVNYYDEKARPIYVYTNNEYLQAIDIAETKLDFTGKVLETTTTHKKTGKADVVVKDYFEYDHQDRLLSQNQKVNDQITERMVSNRYDELGQLKSKLVGNAAKSGYKDITSGISISGDIITKTGSNGWNEGLATLGSIEGDGYIEFKTASTNKWYMVGLSSDNSSPSYNTIDFAAYPAGTHIHIYESGSWKKNCGPFVAGDVIRVERKANKIYYKKNNEVIYISSKTPVGNLLGDISMHSDGTRIQDLHIVDNDKGLQEVDYRYNVRGWLKNINQDTKDDRDLFNFTLRYNDPVNATALYNGNISQTIWSTDNTDTSEKMYSYSYDALNRITGATGSTSSNYDLKGVNYDKNGNILGLERYGHVNEEATEFGVMDDLHYRYDTGNKLLGVLDKSEITQGFKDGNTSTVDYTYDTNGNMIADKNKGIIHIDYNHLNLPTLVQLETGKILYTYDASGVKLRKVVDDGYASSFTTTDYAGNHIYENDKLQFFNQPEGYVKNEDGKFGYVYQYKDHLGNVRLSYADTDESGDISQEEIIEENAYYPFGLKQKGYNNVVSSNGNSTAQKWKYQGQELTEDLGYNMYEYTFRHYDPTIGRFFAIDPLAADYVYNSTYAFQENKLGLGTELEGLELRKHEWLDKEGQNHVDYTANIKVVNNSSASQKDIISYATDVASAITDKFSGTDADGNITSMNVKLEFVDEISSSDFAIEFTDKVTEKSPITGKDRVAAADGKTDEIGNTETNRMQLLIPGRAAPGPYEAVLKEDIGTNGAHEFGHAAGLNHQSSKNNRVSRNNNIPLEQNNLMRTNGRAKQVVNKKQKSVIYNNTKSQPRGRFYKPKKN